MTTDRSAHTSARRIARNASLRLAGELIGKVASLFLFVVVARKLGTTGFGNFTFAFALTGALILVSGLGMDGLTAREIARSHERVDEFLANVVTIKALTSVLAVLAAVAVVQFGDYSADTRHAVILLGIAMAIENLGRTWYAIFQAYERMEFVSISLAVQRVATAAATIAMLAFGGRTATAVAAVYLAGSGLGLALVVLTLPRYIVRPRWRFDPARLLPLAWAGIPIGLASLLFTILLRLDNVLLSFLNSGNNTKVGIYGAAFRLIDSTMFVSWAIAAALFPWLARHSAEGDVQLARGYELGLKAVATVLVPLGLAFAVLARPLIGLLYGDSYDGSVLPLRILGALGLLYAVNYLTSTALTAHDRPGLFTRLFGIVTVVNLGLNLILIPRYGAVGAAISAVGSGVVLAALGLRQAHRVIGALRLGRAFGASLAGAAAMAAVMVPLRSSLAPALVLGSLAYVTAFAAFERLVFPADFRLLAGLWRRRTAPAVLLEPPAGGPESLAP